MVDIQANLALKLDGLQKSTDEVGHAVKDQTAWMMERYRGETFIRLPITQANSTSGVAFSMGGDTGSALQSPEQGFIWSLRELTLEGLTSGATPDVINIRRGSVTGQLLWQLNGNQFAQTWGRGEKVIRAGETLFYVSVGVMGVTGTIRAYGTAQQLPGERIGIFG